MDFGITSHAHDLVEYAGQPFPCVGVANMIRIKTQPPSRRTNPIPLYACAARTLPRQTSPTLWGRWSSPGLFRACGGHLRLFPVAVLIPPDHLGPAASPPGCGRTSYRHRPLCPRHTGGGVSEFVGRARVLRRWRPVLPCRRRASSQGVSPARTDPEARYAPHRVESVQHTTGRSSQGTPPVHGAVVFSPGGEYRVRVSSSVSGTCGSDGGIAAHSTVTSSSVFSVAVAGSRSLPLPTVLILISPRRPNRSTRYFSRVYGATCSQGRIASNCEYLVAGPFSLVDQV